MSKYEKLWDYIKNCDENDLSLTFEEIADISGVLIDHSFLRYKTELLAHGYKVDKISMKEQKVRFEKL